LLHCYGKLSPPEAGRRAPLFSSLQLSAYSIIDEEGFCYFRTDVGGRRMGITGSCVVEGEPASVTVVSTVSGASWESFVMSVR